MEKIDTKQQRAVDRGWYLATIYHSDLYLDGLKPLIEELSKDRDQEKYYKRVLDDVKHGLKKLSDAEFN